jgi:peptide/nickel transport system ATP-binding protein
LDRWSGERPLNEHGPNVPSFSEGLSGTQRAGDRGMASEGGRSNGTAGGEVVAVQVDALSVATEPDELLVLEEVSLEIRHGETVGLVGESGSGKTTLGLALLGYARRGLRIVGGRVVIAGQDILNYDGARMRALRGQVVSYVPQDPAAALNPGLKVSRQLRDILIGRFAGSIDERLREMLDEVRLSDRAVLDAYPHQLSGGQQQRVVLAMAFAMRPPVIVLDEPTTGLDASTQRHVMDTVRELCSAHRVAGVLVSHDLAVVSEIVNEVAVLYAGRIVERGSRRAVFRNPGHPYTQGLLRAVPSVERASTLKGLAGHPPSPGSWAQGCSFAPRCTLRQPACTAAVPAPVETAPGHLVRCLRAGEAVSVIHDEPTMIDAPANERETPARDQPLLTVENLQAHYGARLVLKGVGLTVRRGECLAIVGESGSGKTTLARCVVGLHRHWGGTITLDGEPIAAGTRQRSPVTLRAIQYIFQNPYASLNPRRSIGDAIAQPLDRFFDLKRVERAERVREALESAALSPGLLDRYPTELSGGERQRAAIARALVLEPELLVCDEITSALDVSVQAAVVETLRALQARQHLAVIFITHNLALVRSIAQRTAVVKSGEIVETGATEDVLSRPSAAYTKTLLRDLPRLVLAEAE